MVVITWQEYHRIIVDLLLECFIFAKFNTVLKNVEKGEYLKLKINVLLSLNKILVLLILCYFVKTELMLAILAMFCLMPLHSYRVSSMSLPLWYQNTFL